MKRFKKIASLLLAVVMVLAMTVPAMAATVTIPDDSKAIEKHKFVAYQIFTGTQKAPNDDILGDIEWGDGIDYVKFARALKKGKVNETDSADMAVRVAFVEVETSDAKAVAEALKDNVDLAERVAKIAYGCKTGEGKELTIGSETKLPTGYYLIVDTTGDIGSEAYNAALLQVNADIEIKQKTDWPSAEKKVQENVKYTQDGGYREGYNDTADYNIGDTVPYAFYSEVPDMTYYDTYTYVFHDKMDAGLKFNEDVTVTIGETPLEKGQYTVTVGGSDGEEPRCTFEVSINLKSIEGINAKDKIRIDFTATLTKDAVVGNPGNLNEMWLQFSNNPNEDSLGETPHDKVVVFTYGLNGTKIEAGEPVDEAEKLAGAEFVLYREVKDADGKVIGREYAVVDTKAGKLTKWLSVEPDGEGNYTVPSADDVPRLVSKDDGTFGFSGLDDGTYYLTETKAPAGYNTPEEDKEVIIKAVTNNGQGWDGDTNALTNLTGTVDGESMAAETIDGGILNGILDTTITNPRGTALPDTGGMGTTLFYIIGGVLVVGAVIVLVSKKRAAK